MKKNKYASVSNNAYKANVQEFGIILKTLLGSHEDVENETSTEEETHLLVKG